MVRESDIWKRENINENKEDWKIHPSTIVTSRNTPDDAGNKKIS